MQSRISYFWKESDHCKQFRTGVSIHGHTSHSRESLKFLRIMAKECAPMRWIINAQQRKVEAQFGPGIDILSGHWTPPLTPREAVELEARQIENRLGLQPLVSLSDHDNIEAATQLRVVPVYAELPISVEWTVPYRETSFHIGVHNLPAEHAAAWITRLHEATAQNSPRLLAEVFSELHEIDQVLVVFNHPIWNLSRLDPGRFELVLSDFLAKFSARIHAFELNGLRTWKENQRVAELACAWNQLVISGGDRHAFEPNANVNMTNAACFTEFVREIRVRRVSHVMFMPQFADPLASRFLQTFLDVTRPQPERPEGMQRWDDRVYHCNTRGQPRPLSSLWRRPPQFLDQIFHMAHLLGDSGAHQYLRHSKRKQIALRLNLEDGEVEP